MRLTGYTVLVVEDDVDNLELLTSHLEEEGAIVIGASSSAAALSQAQTQDIDAVLADLELPDGDGCELLQRLRQMPGQSALPAVALTGYSDDLHRAKASACGFDRYAVKPFALEALTELMGELIDRRTDSRGMSCHAVADRAAPGRRAR
jgi:two-component system CheB/CheR fusion protein